MVLPFQKTVRGYLIKSLLLISCFVFTNASRINSSQNNPYVIVLGTAQDAGYPQADCKKICCKRAWDNPQNRRMVSCLGLVDPLSGERWMLDATPDFPDQLRLLNDTLPGNSLSGILLTHAHIGHYTGIMHLGKEVMGATAIPVYAMPRMHDFLKENGPWSQLVHLNNISLRMLKADSTIQLNSRITVTPFAVPHRDEFSETVGYKINGPEKSVIFIPDIDKWERWGVSIKTLVGENDFLFLDGTFFKDGEISRNIKEVPHPFVEESLDLFKDLPDEQKQKIYFIHFNHTNPLLIKDSKEQKQVLEKGFNIAEIKQTILL